MSDESVLKLLMTLAIALEAAWFMHYFDVRRKNR